MPFIPGRLFRWVPGRLYVLSRPPVGTWSAPSGSWCRGCGWHIPTNKKSSPGSPNKSFDISFAPVSAPQVLQEAHGLHILVPRAGAVGRTYQPIKNSSFGSPNKSFDTSFAPVGASQVFQEAHGLHLLVPGAGVVGGRYQSIKNSSSGSPNKSADTLLAYLPL